MRRTEAVGREKNTLSAAASLQVATLVEVMSNHEALVALDGTNFTASLLQSALADIEARGLRAPFPVLVGRTSGAHGTHIVISPAAASGQIALSPARPEKLVITAESSIELRCGDSIIALTKDGKVTIRGVDVHTRAARTCKIKGATVSIN